jgi:hypothetical protein
MPGGTNRIAALTAGVKTCTNAVFAPRCNASLKPDAGGGEDEAGRPEAKAGASRFVLGMVQVLCGLPLIGVFSNSNEITLRRRTKSRRLLGAACSAVASAQRGGFHLVRNAPGHPSSFRPVQARGDGITARAEDGGLSEFPGCASLFRGPSGPPGELTTAGLPGHHRQ